MIIYEFILNKLLWNRISYQKVLIEKVHTVCTDLLKAAVIIVFMLINYRCQRCLCFGMEEHHAKAASAKKSSADERALNHG